MLNDSKDASQCEQNIALSLRTALLQGLCLWMGKGREEKMGRTCELLLFRNTTYIVIASAVYHLMITDRIGHQYNSLVISEECTYPAEMQSRRIHKDVAGFFSSLMKKVHKTRLNLEALSRSSPHPQNLKKSSKIYKLKMKP